MVFNRTGPLLFSVWLLLNVSLKLRYDSGCVELIDMAAKPLVAVRGAALLLEALLLRLVLGAGDGARFIIGCAADCGCCCCISSCCSRVSEVRRELSADVTGVDCAEITLK